MNWPRPSSLVSFFTWPCPTPTSMLCSPYAKLLTVVFQKSYMFTPSCMCSWYHISPKLSQLLIKRVLFHLSKYILQYWQLWRASYDYLERIDLSLPVILLCIVHPCFADFLSLWASWLVDGEDGLWSVSSLYPVLAGWHWQSLLSWYLAQSKHFSRSVTPNYQIQC